jgi:hypothetical protein
MNGTATDEARPFTSRGLSFWPVDSAPRRTSHRANDANPAPAAIVPTG